MDQLTKNPAASGGEGGVLDFFDPSAIPYALAVVIGTIIFVRLLERASTRLSERIVRYRLLIKQTSTFLVFGVYIAGALVAAASLFQLTSGALFALSGTLAVTLGFALKDVAASFLASISILTNRPFQVGDRIQFAGMYGEVREIGLRTVRMVTLDDNVVTIPSNKFLTDAVASSNWGALDCMVVIPFYIEGRANHARAREIVHDAVLASKYLYLGKPFSVLIALQLAEQGQAVVQLTARAYVYDARHEKAFASDVTDRTLTAFRAEGIALAGA